MIASLAGDGIAVALASGAAAAHACLQGDGTGARAYQRAFARRAKRPLAVAETLRHMAEAPLAAEAADAAGGAAGAGRCGRRRLTRIG